MPVRISCHLRHPPPPALSLAVESTLGARRSEFEVVISHAVDEHHAEILILVCGGGRSTVFANLNHSMDVLSEGLLLALTRVERRP
jgi:hypothetical protein